MYKVGINFDEISDDLDTALAVMKQCDITSGELRTVDGKNFVFWSDEEVTTFKKRIAEEGIELIAAATPLFKWYINQDDPEIKHDSFGSNPRLGEDEKRKVIERTFEIAKTLSLPRLRIFSGLGDEEGAGGKFARDPMLIFALELAERHSIDLYIENEPVCCVYTKEQIIELLNGQASPRLKLWLDIANLIEVNEEIDETFLMHVAPRLGYVHVKDFIMQDGERKYVPVGEGQIDYPGILGKINELHVADLIFTVETHAKVDKIGASVKSLKATKDLVYGLENTGR